VLRAADALGVARLAAAVLFPGVLAGALAGVRDERLPLVVFGLAAASDYLDGIVARRTGPTRHGAVLDNLADVAFVLSGTGAGAALGLLPVAVPLAIAAAFGAYVLASLARPRRGLARSALGHAAGVCNFAVVGLVAGAAAVPATAWRGGLRAAGLAVVALNLAAILDRLVPRALASRTDLR
jgi:phosphatidylglycerophosphate synthase